jgi:hypothetical protein
VHLKTHDLKQNSQRKKLSASAPCGIKNIMDRKILIAAYSSESAGKNIL